MTLFQYSIAADALPNSLIAYHLGSDLLVQIRSVQSWILKCRHRGMIVQQRNISVTQADTFTLHSHDIYDPQTCNDKLRDRNAPLMNRGLLHLFVAIVLLSLLFSRTAW